MKIAMAAASLILFVSFLFVSLVFAEGPWIDVVADKTADFAAFKTFMTRAGTVTSQNAALKGKHTLNAIEDVIRASLSAKGLKETSERPDLVATFSIKEEPGPPVRRNGQTLSVSAIVLELSITRRALDKPVWRGTYADNDILEEAAAKLPGQAKALLAGYPLEK